ncbi:hypothetical protein [Streptomyces sp. TLI_146]|uniref:hypothetical protein n=1 Tax=Streptomyces sp. TLI_146 TaxID=1938858 RepID=UPI0015D64F61|nr:hypothetical protein [Streptomyces sp. TLI_146]
MQPERAWTRARAAANSSCSALSARVRSSAQPWSRVESARVSWSVSRTQVSWW